MKILPGLLIFLSLQAFAGADTAVDDRRELHDLLLERKQMFDAYERSLAKRSGFFGNQTKRDMKESHAVLTAIVATDNKIIKTLNRVVDFRNYEKATMNYDLRDRDALLKSLRQSVETLSKRADALAIHNKKLERQVTIRTIFIYILGLAALVLFFLPGKRLK